MFSAYAVTRAQQCVANTTCHAATAAERLYCCCTTVQRAQSACTRVRHTGSAVLHTLSSALQTLVAAEHCL
jgi:hypothetical protein